MSVLVSVLGKQFNEIYQSIRIASMKKMSQWPHLEVFGLQGLVGFTVVKDSQVSHPCRGVRTLETAKKGYYQESEKFSSKDQNCSIVAWVVRVM